MDQNVTYKIITDSGCDISADEEREYNIDIIPFSIVIDDKDYWERIDLSCQEFYELANSSPTVPKTSQITEQRFYEKFVECVNEGYRDVIVVLINSTGSRTYENALRAKQALEESGENGNTTIHVVDSHGYSVGYGFPLVEAAKKLRAGRSVKTVLSYLEDWFNCCEIYIVGFDLRHMKKSGRISAASAILGELMGVRPLISLIDGESKVIKKVRGDRAVVDEAINYISSRAVPETPWSILRTTVPDLENQFIRGYSKKVGSAPSMVNYSGGVVTSNAGTKFFGVVVKGQPRR